MKTNEMPRKRMKLHVVAYSVHRVSRLEFEKIMLVVLITLG